MNEEQRLAQRAQTSNTKEKDYSKYFESVYQPPSLKEAKRRGKEEVRYRDDFEIDERLKQMGKGRTFFIQTFGCQMNEHDTEVMQHI